MTEYLELPDVEAAVVDYLHTRLGVDVGTATPASYPYVRVHRVGGTRDASLNGERVMVAVDAWDTDGVAACDLARAARAHLWAAEQQPIAPDVWVRGVSEIGGLTSTVDPQTDVPRYELTVQLTVRGLPL